VGIIRELYIFVVRKSTFKHSKGDIHSHLPIVHEIEIFEIITVADIRTKYFVIIAFHLEIIYSNLCCKRQDNRKLNSGKICNKTYEKYNGCWTRGYIKLGHTVVWIPY